jgi:ribonuclease HI
MSDKQHVKIYTRGISSPRGSGYGVLLLYKEHRKELSGGTAGTSNYRMDLLAAVEGLTALKCPCRVSLYNANSYVTDGMNKGWARRWQEHNWHISQTKPAAHADLWEELLQLCEVHEVEFVWWSRDHDSEQYKKCGQLARDVTTKQFHDVMEEREKGPEQPGNEECNDC